MAAASPLRRAAARLGADSPAAAFRDWFEGVKAVLLDCDGVIWRGTTPIPGAAEAVEALRAAGRRVVFVSNNSTKSRATYVSKLAKVCGISATEDDIMSSAFAAAALLQSHELQPAEGYDQVGVFVVGEKGLHHELQALGFATHGLDEGGGKAFDFAGFTTEKLLPDVRAVVQGFDSAFNYNKMAIASCYIRYQGARYIATNTDETFPTHGMLIPGGGSMVAALKTGSGVDPEVAGKPSPRLMGLICDKLGVVADECLMVGDRLNTDIRFGNAAAAKTALVMTGVTDEHGVESLGPGGEDTPDVVLDSIASLTALLETSASD